MKELLTYIKIIVSGIIVNLTALLPRKRRMMVFGAWFGQKYDDNSRALFEYVLKERKDIHAYWITANADVFNKMKSMGLPVYLNTSRKGKWLALRTRYYVSVVMLEGKDSGSNLSRYMGGVKVINLWHGIPLKKVVYDDEKHPFWKKNLKRRLIYYFEKIPFRNTYHFATSETMVEIYKSCFRSDDTHVLNLGQARNDYFYQSHTNPYKSRFAGKRIILYMPTHRREGKMLMNMSQLLDLDKIDDVCKKNNAVFLIKKHYYHSNEIPLENGVYDSIVEITSEKPSSQILLDAADVLITDYSSCWIDYLLLDRPILFYCYDIEDYLEFDRDMYFDYKTIVPGKICKEKNMLVEKIDSILKKEDNYAANRASVRDLFYSKDNQQPVSKKQIEAILRL